jgi:Xaa-Pro aminopeptidase
MNVHTVRVERLRAVLRENNVDACATAFGPHLRYLTGYSGSNGVAIVSLAATLFLTDPRYREQAEAEVTADACIVTRDPLLTAASKQRMCSRITRMAFDKETSLYQFASELGERFTAAHIVPTENLLAGCMAVKDAEEIAMLSHAASISDRVFTDLLGLLCVGMTELDVAAEIVSRHRRYGAEGDAFDVIAASGTNSALPHARPTTKTFAPGEFVTLDFGCVYRGYHSDMTRTIAVGEPSREMKHVYAVVLEAQRAAAAAASAGITGKALDETARRIIRARGYGKYFVHGLGHGIGLQIHEEPKVSKKNPEPLPCGSVITIEPGIYVPGKFGVRIEDDVVLRDGGCETITASPKELIIL